MSLQDLNEVTFELSYKHYKSIICFFNIFQRKRTFANPFHLHLHLIVFAF